MAAARWKAIAAGRARTSRQARLNPNPRHPASRGRNVARITAGVASSHVPAIGAAIDNKQTEEPYWKRVFSGFEKSKEWMANAKHDVAIVVYDERASTFSVEILPTSGRGCAVVFSPAVVRCALRPLPS